MEIKRNHATASRPDGDRVIDAPYVFMDIPGYTTQLKREKSWDKNDRNGITIFKADKLTMVVTALKSGAVVARDSDFGYLTIQVLSGEVEVTTQIEVLNLSANQAIAFHPNVEHTIKALSDATLLQTSCCRQ